MDGPGTTALFNGPSGIACDGAGNLYVADSHNNSIRKIVLATRAVTTLAGAAGQWGIADGIGSSRALQGADGHRQRRERATFTSPTATPSGRSPSTPRRCRPSSAPLTKTGCSLGALPASLSGVSGVAVLRAGELAIVDASENAVLIGHL